MAIYYRSILMINLIGDGRERAGPGHADELRLRLAARDNGLTDCGAIRGKIYLDKINRSSISILDSNLK